MWTMTKHTTVYGPLKRLVTCGYYHDKNEVDKYNKFSSPHTLAVQVDWQKNIDW